jgi:hypothetical protein
VCNAQKVIAIPDYVFQQKRAGGIIKIEIHAQGTCEHSFVAFVDQNGTVRGYECIDFQAPPEDIELKPVATPASAALHDFLAKIDKYVSGSLCAVDLSALCELVQAQEGFHVVLPDMRNWLAQLQYGATWDEKARLVFKKKVACWVEKLMTRAPRQSNEGQNARLN